MLAGSLCGASSHNDPVDMWEGLAFESGLPGPRVKLQSATALQLCWDVLVVLMSRQHTCLKHAEYVRFSSTDRLRCIMSFCGTKPIWRLYFSSLPGLCVWAAEGQQCRWLVSQGGGTSCDSSAASAVRLPTAEHG